MIRCLTPIIIVMVSLCCSTALAIKQLVHVSPNASTFLVERQQGDRMIRFKIIRDPADAQQPQNKSLILVRSAHLQVSDGKRTLLTAPIAPHVRSDGKLSYVFRLAEEHAPHSVFIISEIEDSRHRSGYIGGGTIYEYTMNGNSAIKEAMRRILDRKRSPDSK